MTNPAAPRQVSATAEAFDGIEARQPLGEALFYGSARRALVAEPAAHCTPLSPAALANRPPRKRYAPMSGAPDEYALGHGVAEPGGADASDAAESASTPQSTMLLALLRLRRLRESLFPEPVFAQPAWDMLLELLECQLRRKRISVSGLYLAAGVPPATALRRIHEMEQAGLVQRCYDPRDRRRQFVELSPRTLAQLQIFFQNEAVLSTLQVDRSRPYR